MVKCIKNGKIAKDKIKGKTLNKGVELLMIKKIAWETFKNTGDINAFMEFKQIEDIEKGIEEHSSKFVKQEKEGDTFFEKNKTFKNEA